MWRSSGRLAAAKNGALQFRMILIWSYSTGIESIEVGKPPAIQLRTWCVRSRDIALSASHTVTRLRSRTMKPIAVTYSASSPCDGRAAGEGEGCCAGPVYSGSKLQIAKRMTAAMRGATFAKRCGMIRHARAQRSLFDFDGALHFRVERCRNGEAETAALAGLIEILSATGPRYNLV